jgi:hypothetical protein
MQTTLQPLGREVQIGCVLRDAEQPTPKHWTAAPRRGDREGPQFKSHKGGMSGSRGAKPLIPSGGPCSAGYCPIKDEPGRLSTASSSPRICGGAEAQSHRPCPSCVGVAPRPSTSMARHILSHPSTNHLLHPITSPFLPLPCHLSGSPPRILIYSPILPLLRPPASIPLVRTSQPSTS